MDCEKIQNQLLKYKQYFLNKNNQLKKINKKSIEKIPEEFFNILNQIQNHFLNQKKFNFNKNEDIKNFLTFIFKENCQFTCFYPNCNNLRKITKNKAGIRISKFCENHYNDKDINKYKSLIQKNKKISKETIEKRKKTLIKKYGVDNPMKIKNIQEKVYKSWKNKSEDEIKKIVKKREKTSLIKFKVKNPMQSKEIQNKLKSKTINKFNNNQKIEKYKYLFKIFENSKIHIKDYNQIIKLNHEFIKNNFIDKNNKLLIKKLCNFYGFELSNAYKFLNQINFNFNKSSGISESEKEILNFIKEIYSGEIIENSRKIINPYELDIYIPEKNLAIEYNGLLFHSFGKKIFTNKELDLQFQKYRHLEKTKLAEEKNINLLHIFENEWLDPIKQDIWKSIISYKLGIVKQRYFARKLEIKEVNNKEAKEFFEENHIQGYTNAEIKIGLFDNQKLISCMTFAKPRFNKNYQYELIRFASIKYSSCVGCAQKLFKYFLRTYQPESIISYANRRWAFAKSNVYQNLNFKFIKETEPNYYYFKLDEMKFYHRSHFQKHKLKNYSNTKDQYDPSLTESKIMFNSGYRRIYDAGQLTYEWRA